MDQAERIIARFGGIRPMAAKLGIAVTTVQGWKERGSIPPARHAQIRAAAEAEGLTLSDDDLDAGKRSPAPPADEAISETIEPLEPVEEPVAEPPQELSPAYDAPTSRVRSPARAVLIGGLLGVIVAGGAGYAGWTMRGPTPAGVPPELSQRIAAIAKRAEDAETRAGAAETRARAAEAKIAELAGKQARLEASGSGDAARAIAALKAELAKLAARLKATAPSEKLQALGAGLAALKSQLDELATRRQTGPGDKAALDALKTGLAALQANLAKQIDKLSGALAGLDKRLAALDARVAGLGKAGPVEALGRRLSELEKRRVSASGGRGAALIAGIGQLREAVRTGDAFSSELESVTALAGKDPRLSSPLQILASFAGKGVPTTASLTRRFSRAAPAIVRAGRIPEGGGWAARAWARARSVVVVRRIGPEVTGADAEAVVARAEARLAIGDVTGAAAMLEGLQGPAGKAAMPWLAAAGAHIEAARAVLALHRAALASISSPAKKPAMAKPPIPAKPPFPAKPKTAP